MSKKSGPAPAYTSPGSPEHLKHIPKSGTNHRRRPITASAAFIPLSSGKTPPSKWDDAERWITSPITGQARSTRRTTLPKPPSKKNSRTNPLTAPGVVHSSSHPPSVAKVEGSNLRSVVEESPIGCRTFLGCDGGLGRREFEFEFDSLGDVANSDGKLEALNSILIPRGEKINHGSKDDDFVVAKAKDDRDLTTQINNKRDISSPPSTKGNSSFSTTTIASSIPTNMDNDAKDNIIRDVQIDQSTATIEQSKSQEQNSTLGSDEVSSPWNATEASTNIYKLQLEKAKILAWENLQKAEADEAIRKLEMKLEKKRLASSEKIMNKFKAAQMKAETLRNALHLHENDYEIHEQHLVLRKGIFSCLDVKKSSVCNCFSYRSKN